MATSMPKTGYNPTMENEKGPSDHFREIRETRQTYEDARHALLYAIEAPAGPIVGLPGHSPYNRLTMLVNDFRDAHTAFREALADGSDAQMRLQADFSDIQTRAAQKLLDISPYDLEPEE